MNATANPQRILVTEEQGAELLSISVQTLYRLRMAGDVPFVQLGNRNIRYLVSDLVAWAESRRQTRQTDSDAV